jgi:hypothetical protein
VTNTDDPKNPSVPFAQAFDQGCPGGKAHFIVYFIQGTPEREEPYWQMERTDDGEAFASGTLEAMLALVGTEAYPHSRRATWAEDMQRFRPRIFDLPAGVFEPVRIRRDYTDQPRRKIVDSTPEEIREVLRAFEKPDGEP